MSYQCKGCDKVIETEPQLKTHVLLNHPELARDNSELYESEVSKGHLNEKEIEKGEQFGYKK